MKYSRQREAVLECLRGRHDHPTADAIFQTLREDDPKISLGTVYRNLGLLTELGQIQKISCGDGTERYDACMDPHYHFICNHCGKIIDLHSRPIEHVNDAAVDEDIAVVDTHSLIFRGICKICYKSGRGEH